MTTGYAPEGTFRFYLDQFQSAGWMRTQYSSGFFGILFGLVPDEAVESWTLACKMPLLAHRDSPDDVLPYIGQDRHLSRYYLESPAEHRNRLLNAWDLYLDGGTEDAIERELLSAKYGPTVFMGVYGDETVSYGDPQFFYLDKGAYVEFRYNAPGPRGEPPPYKTQFWVVFNEGFHPVTDEPLPWGSWDWGDLSPGVWGPEGFTQEFSKTIDDIVYKWKSPEYVFRGYTFLISPINYRDVSVTYGDPTVIYQGSISVDRHV